jgi:hypothetical protein
VALQPLELGRAQPELLVLARQLDRPLLQLRRLLAHFTLPALELLEPVGEAGLGSRLILDLRGQVRSFLLEPREAGLDVCLQRGKLLLAPEKGGLRALQALRLLTELGSLGGQLLCPPLKIGRARRRALLLTVKRLLGRGDGSLAARNLGHPKVELP